MMLPLSSEVVSSFLVSKDIQIEIHKTAAVVVVFMDVKLHSHAKEKAQVHTI
jgi:hypothetical protein